MKSTITRRVPPILIGLVLGFILGYPLARVPVEAVETRTTPEGTAYAFEQLTVSTTALGFTAATISPTTSTAAKSAFCTVEAQPIRFRISGTPTAAIGHPGAAGYEFTVVGINNLLTFRAIRSAAADATLTCTFFR